MTDWSGWIRRKPSKTQYLICWLIRPETPYMKIHIFAAFSRAIKPTVGSSQSNDKIPRTTFFAGVRLSWCGVRLYGIGEDDGFQVLNPFERAVANDQPAGRGFIRTIGPCKPFFEYWQNFPKCTRLRLLHRPLEVMPLYSAFALPYHSTNESALVFDVSLLLYCVASEPRFCVIRCDLKNLVVVSHTTLLPLLLSSRFSRR